LLDQELRNQMRGEKEEGSSELRCFYLLPDSEDILVAAESDKQKK